MRILWRSAIVAACLTTAACGGDAGTGDSSPAVAIPTPTPTATATSYPQASDFTRDRSFTAIGIRSASNSQTGVNMLTLDPEASSIGFDFTAATRTYALRYGEDAGTITIPAMSGVSYDLYSTSGIYFSRSSLAVTDGTSGKSIPSAYFGYVVWSTSDQSNGTIAQSVTRRLLFGARTLVSDLPTGGTVTFVGTSDINGGANGGSGSASTITINYSSGVVTAETNFVPYSTGGTGSSMYGVQPTPQPITLSGTLDRSTGRITGTATHVPSGASGRFEGALYGPRGLEVGMVLTITAADGTLYYGIVGGRS